MNTSSTPEPSAQDKIIPPSYSDPIVKEFQLGQSGIPAEITQTLSKVEPDVALDYVNKWVSLEYQDRDKDRSLQLQLAQAKLGLEKERELNKAADRAADRNFVQGYVRWGLSVFLAIFLTSLGFSYAVKDAEGKIPQYVLSIAAGVLGGTGISTGLNRQNHSKDDDNKKS